jgi:hypothetical protein
MHLLIGFIQLLLVLTDSRFLPDMSGFWHADTVKSTKTSKSGKGMSVEYPTEKKGNLLFEIALPTGNSKMLLPAGSIANHSGDQVRNTIQFPLRVIPTSKLYLIFCQLKTEG